MRKPTISFGLDNEYTRNPFTSDQPTTCPKYGVKTDVVLDMSHTAGRMGVQECLGCGYQFIVQIVKNSTIEQTL
ncbi:MAG: hypothetical protein SGI87_11555 [Flavobacteriales bacterium]|nr:hypothetical protein [Flavobacteriales bacterium]